MSSECLQVHVRVGKVGGVPIEEVLAQMRASDPTVHYLVVTPKGRLTRLEQALLEKKKIIRNATEVIISLAVPKMGYRAKQMETADKGGHDLQRMLEHQGDDPDEQVKLACDARGKDMTLVGIEENEPEKVVAVEDRDRVTCFVMRREDTPRVQLAAED